MNEDLAQRCKVGIKDLKNDIFSAPWRLTALAYRQAVPPLRAAFGSLPRRFPAAWFCTRIFCLLFQLSAFSFSGFSFCR